MTTCKSLLAKVCRLSARYHLAEKTDDMGFAGEEAQKLHYAVLDARDNNCGQKAIENEIRKGRDAAITALANVAFMGKTSKRKYIIK